MCNFKLFDLINIFPQDVHSFLAEIDNFETITKYNYELENVDEFGLKFTTWQMKMIQAAAHDFCLFLLFDTF